MEDQKISGKRKRWRVAVSVVFVAGIILFGTWLMLRPSPDKSPQKDETQTTQKPSETEPQNVSIDNLTPGQTVSGEVMIRISIDDPGRVQRVEYHVDGLFAGVTYAAPFSFKLDTTALSEGEHTIVAKVYNKDGSSVSSPPVTILVPAQGAVSQQASSSASKHSRHTQGHGTGDASGDGEEGPPADTSPPSTPNNLVLSAEDGYTASLSWDASSDNVGVTGYQVLRDGVVLGAATTLSYQDQTVVPGNTYEYSVKALDAAGNVSAASIEPSITLEPTSIWLEDADTPQTVESSDGDSYELGVKFSPLVDGKVTGVKFYKAVNNTGTHIGNLWEGDGTHLASVTFSSETATGWQTATFSTPVDVEAGTTYVASYSAPNGRFSTSSQYFQAEGITSQYLTALASGVDGNNGVFNEDPGEFPAGSFQNTNYWIDVTFAPNPSAGGPSVKQLDNSVVHPGFPGSNNTGVPVGKRLPTRDRGIIAYQSVTIKNIEVTGIIEVRAANVTIESSKINGVVYLDTAAPGSGSWSVTIEDSEVAAGNTTVGAVREGNITITRSNIHGGQHNVHCGGNCTVTDSWLHGQYVFNTPSDSHNNGFLSNGGSNMTISGSTLSCDQPASGDAGCSGDLSLFGDFAPITDVTIDSNLFTGSVDTPFCLFAGYQSDKTHGLDADNIDITNNIFQRGSTGNCGAFGPVTNYLLDGTGTPPPNSTWQNNKWDDGTAIIQ